MMSLHLDYWHNLIQTQSHIFSFFLLNRLISKLTRFIHVCRSKIDLNLTPSPLSLKRPIWISQLGFFLPNDEKFVQSKAWRLHFQWWWMSKMTWSWIRIIWMILKIRECESYSKMIILNEWIRRVAFRFIMNIFTEDSRGSLFSV